MKKIVRFSLVFLAIPALAANAAYVYDKIGSIDGAQSVHVRKDQAVREARSGDPVMPGETVFTDAGVTATVRCPDGSVLIVGQKSELTVEDDTEHSRTAKIDSGTVRAIVSKINTENPASTSKYRFFLKNRSISMGVRGTDFIVSADATSANTDLHTMSGTVVVAKDIEAIFKTGGVPVSGGSCVLATPDKISDPVPFDLAAFSEQLRRSQPGLIMQEPAPSPKPSKEPLWTRRSSYSKGDSMYFVGSATNADSLEEGRKIAAEAAQQELQVYLKSTDTQGLTLETKMTYEEKTGDHYKVFHLGAVKLKAIEDFKARQKSGS